MEEKGTTRRTQYYNSREDDDSSASDIDLPAEDDKSALNKVPLHIANLHHH